MLSNQNTQKSINIQKLLHEKTTCASSQKKISSMKCSCQKVKPEPDLGSTNNLQDSHKTKEQENCTNGVKSANPDWETIIPTIKFFNK